MRRWALLIVLTLWGVQGETEPMWKLFQNLVQFPGRPGRPAIVEPVVSVEPTQGPWKRNISWGGQYNDAMPAAPGAEIPLFESDQIPGPPRVQSVVLMRNPQSDPGANADFRARIEYSVGSAFDSFLCDWTRGAQFAIVANWVRVVAVSYAPTDTDVYDPLEASGSGNRAKIIIGAGIAEGSTYPREPLTFTTPLNPVADGATEEFLAPDFARAVLINSPNATIPSPSNIVVQLGSGANALARFSYEEIHAHARGVLLPGGTRYLLLTNGSGAVRSMSVVWILGL